MLNKTQAKAKIRELIQNFTDNEESYLKADYNETLLRNDFLNPFFQALGWDIHNNEGKPTNQREVILEEGLKANVSSNTKKPDYTFRLFAERKFFLEAKKPSVNIETNDETARQVRRYGFTGKLKISVLSNFKNLAIYDCSIKVDRDDGVRKSLVKTYHYSEYEEKFDEIYEYLSKETVYSGKFDEIWSHIEDKLKYFSVDDLFLQQINEWRLLLGQDIYNFKPDIPEEYLNDLVQSYLNSIIFLRVCEDRNLEEYQTLLQFATNEDFEALILKFHAADKKYNSGLFDQEFQEEIIKNNRSIFWKIIKQLYYPESPYSFSVFASDILGNIYEIFLSEKLKIENGKISLEKKPDHADRDIITTPTNIIHDLIEETVIPFCQGRSDEEILNSKFADIACGSGAFLLETYQILNDLLIDYYLKNDRSKLIQTSVDSYKLPFDIKKKVLVNCIFGIDKDFNAVQASKFGLLLKLLEEETDKTIPSDKPILPALNNNIHYGNSLLSSADVKEDLRNKINPYDFEEKYDVILGNPPYMKSEDMKNITPQELPLYRKTYNSAYKQFDKYFLFLERGKNLLKDNGYLGYILPSKFTKVGAGKELRKLLKDSRNILTIISFGAHQVFNDKTTYTCLLVLNKGKHETFDYLEVKDFTKWKVKEYEKKDFESVNTYELDDEVWILVPADLKKAYKKINKLSISLDELIGEENIFNGIQTSANNIYVHKTEKEDSKYYFFNKDGIQYKIEKELTRPYFQTSSGKDNLYTYRPFQPNSIVIYPYKKNKNELELVDINEIKHSYPFAYEYLLKHKVDLGKRDIKPEPKTQDEWYRYGRHQSLEKCEVEEKIVVGVLSAGGKYAIDYNKTLLSSGGTAGYCVITLPENFQYSIYYIQALLSSKYIEWYSSLIGEIFRGGYIARGTKVLKKLPIRKIDFTNKNEKTLHDQIAKTQKELIKLQGSIDRSSNDRELEPLKRQFSQKKSGLDESLKDLFQLGEDDQNIPLISEMYATN